MKTGHLAPSGGFRCRNGVWLDKHLDSYNDFVEKSSSEKL